MIDSQSDLNPNPGDNSWSPRPVLKSKEPVRDTNADGIPDNWLEKNHPGKRSNDPDENGYTYLEVYLNSLVQHITDKQ